MACSQQELSAHASAADLGRGDRVRRQSGGGCAYAGKRGSAGAQRGRVRHWFPEEAETWPEELLVVTAEYSEQSLVGLLHRRLICTTVSLFHSRDTSSFLSQSRDLKIRWIDLFPSYFSLQEFPCGYLVELDCHGHISLSIDKLHSTR